MGRDVRRCQVVVNECGLGGSLSLNWLENFRSHKNKMTTPEAEKEVES